ncbi:MAG TPA: peptidase MA family metallohydrolase [Candidatus Sulfotelmatobacter sp.]|nr:peptidase MA family metallohydrolase [Candidatus Sulfotelmatobacter sp.]
MYIVVNKAEEKDGKIEYWVGSTKYTIGKNAVDRIVPGDPPKHSSSGSAAGIQDLTRRQSGSGAGAHDKLQLPLLKGPAPEDTYWANLRDRITSGHGIDKMRLAEIELENNPRTTANAYFLAGVTEMQSGDADAASTYFERAIRAAPEQVNLLEWDAIALASQGRYVDADSQLERAAKLQPNSVDVFRLLAMARYDADRTSDAIDAWKHVLELAPDANTERLLHKAERELQVEERSNKKESLHFTLHYQGDRTSSGFQRELLATLENQYQELAREFGYEPASNIIVILYTQKEFMDITEAPAWAGALNDGKLRIPVGGLTSMTPSLERVLKHELTHSFVASLGAGRCPTWLNEGIAQMMEGRSSSGLPQEVGQLFRERKEIPLSVLQGSFVRFSNIQAQVAYAESLAAADYLRQRYGMGEVRRMLESIASGVPDEQALRNSTGLDYSELERRVGESLSR